jgi:hypothetical protein
MDVGGGVQRRRSGGGLGFPAGSYEKFTDEVKSEGRCRWAAGGRTPVWRLRCKRERNDGASGGGKELGWEKNHGYLQRKKMYAVEKSG